jgi:hypothetical protein
MIRHPLRSRFHLFRFNYANESRLTLSKVGNRVRPEPQRIIKGAIEPGRTVHPHCIRHPSERQLLRERRHAEPKRPREEPLAASSVSTFVSELNILTSRVGTIEQRREDHLCKGTGQLGWAPTTKCPEMGRAETASPFCSRSVRSIAY